MALLSAIILRDTPANRPAFGTAGRLFFDTTNSILYRDSGSAWESVEGGGFTNPMTTAGDIIKGGVSGAAGRLAIGSTNDVLTVVAGAPAWAAPAGGSAAFSGCRIRNNGTQGISNATYTDLAWDTDEDDTANYHYTSAANLTGTASKTNGNATITGSGTAFSTELGVGQVIDVPGGGATDRLVVSAIASNTSLTVAVAPTHTASGQTATRVNAAIGFLVVGWTEWTATINFAANGTGSYRLAKLWKNTTTDVGVNWNVGTLGAGAATGFTMTGKIKVAIGDTVVVRVYQDSGGALNVGFADGGDIQNTLTMQFVGT